MMACFCCVCMVKSQAPAPADSIKKPFHLGLHLSLTDFETVQSISSSSISSVLKNKQWAKPPAMSLGLGIDAWKGITQHIDLFGSINYTTNRNGFALPTTNTTTYRLWTAEIAAQFKLLSDKHPVRPYISGGAGFYAQNKTFGGYAPVAAGFQFHLAQQALVQIQSQYQWAFSSSDNSSLVYSVSMATALPNKKAKAVKPIAETTQPPVPAVVTLPIVETPKVLPAKTVAITVLDEATGKPLPNTLVSLSTDSGAVQTATTNQDGLATFTGISPNNYSITGMLHQIPTSAETLTVLAFDTNNDLVPITLTHNDPRFTLVGIVLNKKTGNAEGEVMVTALNQTRNSEKTTTTRADDGAFEMQLEPASDFSISGKKASYISNIETVSTMALNRSTTLFVELQLTIEQVQAGQSIVLNNIYYATGSAKLNAASSSDLKKVTRFLLDNPTLRIQISSHTDSRGSAAANLSLSNARATAVANYLKALGIPPAQMVTKGSGEAQLLNDCADGKPCSEAQHQQNRRTTFNLIQ